LAVIAIAFRAKSSC